MIEDVSGHKTDEKKIEIQKHRHDTRDDSGSNLRKHLEKWMVDGYKEFTKSGSIKYSSYQEIFDRISMSWGDVPKSAIINAFKKTSIDFYSTRFDYESDESETKEDQEACNL
ncbi:hypothetical protein MXB_1484 [Myxobolus squamalis]|nr:hypothetical protein MXB_1484 [Myxobolus squamalis]